MLDRENMDLKIILSFTHAYQRLYEKGEITARQRDRVLSLIEQYKNYQPEEFKAELSEIFQRSS